MDRTLNMPILSFKDLDAVMQQETLPTAYLRIIDNILQQGLPAKETALLCQKAAADFAERRAWPAPKPPYRPPLTYDAAKEVLEASYATLLRLHKQRGEDGHPIDKHVRALTGG